jgi:hypothetical protein
MVRVFKDTIGSEIPHVRVGIIEDVLFHAEEGFFGFVFSVTHGTEFGERFFDGAIAMRTFESRVLSAVFTSTTFVDLFS